MKSQPVYETTRLVNEVKIQYFFTSTGEKTIFKLIEYSPVAEINNRRIYNLGFGDYDEASGTVIDDSNSNNGDMYLVFNTVLNTVPLFFAQRPNDIIMVGGSDSHHEFTDDCKLRCRKKCAEEQCRNFQRRMKVYRYFVDKRFDELSKAFAFFGRNTADSNIFDEYVPYQDYDVFLVYKKK